MKTFWVVTYFGEGMSPIKKKFDTEEDALDLWDSMAGDTHKSRVSVDKIEVIRKGR